MDLLSGTWFHGRRKRREVMRYKTLVIGYALALALLLFAQHRPDTVAPSGFSGVVDLTHSYSRVQAQVPASAFGLARNAALTQKDSPHRVSVSSQANTRIDAPAHLQQGMWTVDQIPPERL